MPEPKRVDFEQPEKKSPGDKPRVPIRERIPRMPEMVRVDPEALKRPDQRSVACVNLKLAGASFHEIAKELDYASPEAARTAYYSALAGMYPQEDIESLRQLEAMRAELLFRQSLAMASADFLVATEIDEETGEEREVRVPNNDRLRWHQQAGQDLALHAAITGAKAPARMEVSATSEEISRIVHLMVQAEGVQEYEADIFQITEIEAIGVEPGDREE